MACHGTFAHDQVTIAGVPAWKTDPQLCPLLPVTQLGSHIIDIMELIAGPVDFVACAAQANVIRGPSGDPVDTTASLMQFTGGVVGTLQSHYIVPDRYELEFHGTRGWLVLEGHRLTAAERTLGGLEIREETFDEAPLASFVAELEEFARCVRGRNQPSSDAQAALQTLAVVEAMDLSAREHRIVHVSEIALSGAS